MPHATQARKTQKERERGVALQKQHRRNIKEGKQRGISITFSA